MVRGRVLAGDNDQAWEQFTSMEQQICIELDTGVITRVQNYKA
jgi:hypothetical protein